MQDNKVYKGIGIMSGTSMDGLDLCYSEYGYKKKEWFFSPGQAKTIPYPEDLKEKLQNALEFDGEHLIALDSEYGTWIGRKTDEFIKKNKLEPDFIASHGHTVFHQPEKQCTLQIGDGNSIHAATGLPVIYNFRKLDVALGGQGAPLVPVGDALLFSDFDYCLNLGGIANISKANGNKTIAYDICAANMVLNHLSRRDGEDYDADGKKAAKGELIDQLLKELDNYVFYSKKGPKSLGYEDISKNIFPLLSEDYVTDDLLNTFTHHIALKVSETLKNLNAEEGQKMLVSGGGARNKYLIKLLKEYCKPVKVEIPTPVIIDYKEAIVFGFLGLLRLLGQSNVWAQVTGASKDSCSGTVVGDISLKK